MVATPRSGGTMQQEKLRYWPRTSRSSDGRGHASRVAVAKLKWYQAFTACTSRVIVTSSPTRMPPVSNAAFQVRPKSLRLNFVVADKPLRVLPHGSFPGSDGPSTANVTFRVTP